MYEIYGSNSRNETFGYYIDVGQIHIIASIQDLLVQYNEKRIIIHFGVLVCRIDILTRVSYFLNVWMYSFYFSPTHASFF